MIVVDQIMPSNLVEDSKFLCSSREGDCREMTDQLRPRLSRFSRLSMGSISRGHVHRKLLSKLFLKKFHDTGSSKDKATDRWAVAWVSMRHPCTGTSASSTVTRSDHAPARAVYWAQEALFVAPAQCSAFKNER